MYHELKANSLNKWNALMRYTFCDIRLCRQVIVNWRFGGICHINISVWKVIQATNQPQANRMSQNHSVALSPQANYTDWATATCRRNLVPTLVDRGVSRGQRCGSPQLSRPEPLLFFQVAPNLLSQGLLLRKSGSAGIRARNFWVSSQELWLLDHRGGLSQNHMKLHYKR
jgi:hypothetical protein